MISTPDGTLTHDPQLRGLLLYTSELQVLISTASGTRTHTGISSHQILSLMRLPIPPLLRRVLNRVLSKHPQGNICDNY